MGSNEFERAAISTGRSSLLRVLGVKQELGTEVACWGGVGRTAAVGDQAALFAEYSTALDTLVADATDHGYNKHVS